MKVGITGHQQLDSGSDWNWVTAAMIQVLNSLGGSVDGISSLAIGADQIFASLVLELGGHLHAVIPFAGYEKTFDVKDISVYHRILSAASTTEIVQVPGTDEDAYLAAGKRIVEMSDTLIAIWNGLPAKGKGGTADIVAYANRKNKPVIHINPMDHTVVNK
ncbi:MAG: hypothetical protein WC566_02470 [Dehalococcoidia bacterium]